MWKCASEAKLRKSLFVTLFSLLITAILFYFVQNSAVLSGGNIALPKLLWLSLVIFCWFFLPILMAIDARLFDIRVFLFIFIGNMLLRAVIELVMMFVTNNWHPYYGIGHDILTMILCLALSFGVYSKTKLVAGYFFVMAILFVIESVFAWYMLNNVHNETGIVYYVPNEDAHQMVLQLTTVVVLATFTYLIVFIRKWLDGTSFKS